MKKIWFGFSKKEAIGSKIIRWFLDTDFSHTYFKFKEFDRNVIFHAIGKGLTFITEDQFLKDNSVIKEFELEISEELYLKLIQDCFDNCNKKYGYFQNLGLFIQKIMKCLGRDIQINPFDDGINCSELMAMYLKIIYPDDWKNVDLNSVDPYEIYLFLLGKEKWLKRDLLP